MSASFTLTLDTTAPANPSLLINDGAAQTGDPTAWVTLSSPDVLSGARDVWQMKVWGDVNPMNDPAFTPQEADAQWITYTEQVPITLSAGAGRKHLYARLRDDVGNQTLPFTDFIDFDPTLPIVSITTAVDRSRISKVSPFDTATFIWQASTDYTDYEIRVVPSPGSPQQAGVAIGTTHGSLNTGDAGGLANTPVTTTITGADLEAASPGNTTKVVKVFIRSTSGVWSA